jgi:WD40 repeat protein
VTPYANAIALAPQGPYALLAMIDDTLRTWSPSERRLGPVLTGHTHDVVDVALSRDGSLAVSASEDGTVRLWNVADSDASDSFASQATAGHRGLINTVAVTPDGARALSASEDHTIIIWDATTGAANMTLPHNESVVEIHVTADGERAVSRSSDRLLRAWRVATGELDGVWAGADRHAEWPNDRRVVLTHKGGRLVYAYTDGLSHGIEMHRIASGRKGWRFEGEWHVNDLAASSDYVLVCTDRGEVLVLCAKTGSQLHRLNARDAHPFRAAVLPGARALVGYSDGMLRFWDLQTGRVLRTIRSGPRAHDANISALAVVEDLDVAVSGDERGVLMVWDLRELAAHARLVGHTDRVWNLAVAPGGRLVASASADQTLRVWDVPAGAQLTALRTDGAVNSCACGPDGLIVAGGNSGQIQVLDLIEP